MRALMTGVTGFVGGHLAEHLLASDDIVIGLSSSGRWPEGLQFLARDVRLERCDLADGSSEELGELIARKQPEVIYHLAAQSNPQQSVSDPRGTWALNLGGTFNLLEAVRGAKSTAKVIIVSSGVCYGSPAPEFLPVTETCPLRPNNPYSASKGAADLLGVQYVLGYGQDVVMARPFNHAGPRQSETYALSSFAKQVAEIEVGLRPRIEVGNLEVTRDFTDVRDIVTAYRLLATKGKAGEIYNIGTGRDISLKRMLEILKEQSSANVEIHVDPARVRPVDQPLLLADASKLRAETGWEPQFTTEQTLRDMLDYWRKQVKATVQVAG